MVSGCLMIPHSEKVKYPFIVACFWFPLLVFLYLNLWCSSHKWKARVAIEAAVDEYKREKQKLDGRQGWCEILQEITDDLQEEFGVILQREESSGQLSLHLIYMSCLLMACVTCYVCCAWNALCMTDIFVVHDIKTERGRAYRILFLAKRLLLFGTNSRGLGNRYRRPRKIEK